jgi:hypothetical protein
MTVGHQTNAIATIGENIRVRCFALRGREEL